MHFSERDFFKEIYLKSLIKNNNLSIPGRGKATIHQINLPQISKFGR
jgi:hypothetical protein